MVLMEAPIHAEHILNFHELVTGTADIQEILEGVTVFTANAMSQALGENIDCALTPRRRQRTAPVAGSSPLAVLLDGIGQRFGQGPCLDALDQGRPLLLDDITTDVSWPECSRALGAHGRRSALGVPLDLGESSEAVLNFFALKPGLFTARVIDEAAGFAALLAAPCAWYSGSKPCSRSTLT